MGVIYGLLIWFEFLGVFFGVPFVLGSILKLYGDNKLGQTTNDYSSFPNNSDNNSTKYVDDDPYVDLEALADDYREECGYPDVYDGDFWD